MSKLWSSRFSSDTNQLVDEFNASILFDQRFYPYDILGSIAHARMLGQVGIIEKDDADLIIQTLEEIKVDFDRGAIEISIADEDIHMCVEKELTKRIGDVGKKLHTARSRNDQVALDFRLYLKAEIQIILGLTLDLIAVLKDIAQEHTDTILPAYTHLQRAQPTTFAHVLMAYANMVVRDVSRLEDCFLRMDFMPLGSGALTSTTYPIDREMVAKELGFSKLTENSLDGVSDRDYAIELLSDCSILMMHLSRFSEEVILWSSWEFKFIELSDAYSTGSSMMPQKKNPDIAELVRGKTGRVYGSLMAFLTVMKALPLAYNKDMQEDKESVFDTIDTIKQVLPLFAAMLKTMSIRKDRMKKAASEGFINATDCADYLVKKQIPFREAYGIVGKCVAYCIEKEYTLETLPLEDFKQFSPLFDKDVYEAIDLHSCVQRRNVLGGPSSKMVQIQIESIETFLNSWKAS